MSTSQPRNSGNPDRNTGGTGPGSEARQVMVRPAGVVVIAVVLLLEAIALLTAAGFYVHGLVTSTPASFGGAIFMLVLLLLLSTWIFAVGHFLFRGFRWTRAAALVWQLFMIVLAVPTLSGGFVLYGTALLIPPVVALLLLFDKKVIAYTSLAAKPPAVL